MKDKIYNKISTEINPEFAGWYNTDKGELFWFQQEKVWSCRDEYVSDEYPKFWYKELAQLKAEAENHTISCSSKIDLSKDEVKIFVNGEKIDINECPYNQLFNEAEAEKEVSDENDFVQYVTNLLYNAYADGKQQINPDVFDEWVEKEMENMSEFYASHNLLARKVSDEIIKPTADMKREELIKLINDFIDTPMGTNVEVFVDEYLAARTEQEKEVKHQLK